MKGHTKPHEEPQEENHMKSNGEDNCIDIIKHGISISFVTLSFFYTF